MWDADTLDHRYPQSFVSNHERISTRLLCYDTLLDSIRKFYAIVSHGQQTKVGLTKLIMGDLGQRTNELA